MNWSNQNPWSIGRPPVSVVSPAWLYEPTIGASIEQYRSIHRAVPQVHPTTPRRSVHTTGNKESGAMSPKPRTRIRPKRGGFIAFLSWSDLLERLDSSEEPSKGTAFLYSGLDQTRLAFISWLDPASMHHEENCGMGSWKI